MCDFRRTWCVLVVWCSVTAGGAGVVDGSDVGDVSPQRERPQCPAAAGAACVQRDRSTNEYFYTVNGKPQMMTFAEGDFFKMRCTGGALDDPAMPRFRRPVLVRRALLDQCGPPRRAGSYAAALRALNVRLAGRLALERLPPDANLTAAALGGADPPLEELELGAAGAGPLDAAPDALAGLPGLRALVLAGVRAAGLPRSLRRLKLRHAGLAALPALPELEELVVTASSAPDVRSLRAMARLRVLALSAPLGARPALPGALVNVSLAALLETEAAAWAGCGELRALDVSFGALRRLPAGWVGACGRLGSLGVAMMPALRSLPPRLLEGARELERLRVSWCALRTLPPDLLEYSPRLRDLDLSRNELEFLPDGVFAAGARSLRTLDLSYNRLGGGVAGAALPPLAGLRALSLARNPLGDLCRGDVSSRGTSWLSPLRALRRLSLSGVGLRVVCADWLRDMRLLQALDLTDNNITSLGLGEVAMLRRAGPAELDLGGNPLAWLTADELDFRNAQAASDQAQRTAVLLTRPVRCDCTAYWWWRALREARVPATLRPRCPDGRELAALPEAALWCRVEPPACPPGCACRVWPGVGPGARPGARPGVRLRCGAGPAPGQWARLPARAAELSLSGANLTDLPDHLPADLDLLDLSNNSISVADEARWARALGAARRVRLAGNPLACDCRAGSPLDAVRAALERIEDLAAAECGPGTGGGSLREALRGEPCAERRRRAGLARAALGAAGGAALAALGWLAWRRARRRRAAREARRDPRPFDVFVAHADDAAGRRAGRALAAALQRAGLRAGLAAAHWPPGEWLPDLIVWSVRGARCTLVVGTPGWRRDRWLGAALREAGRAGGALLLLLDPAEPLPRRSPAARPLRLRAAADWPRVLRALPAPRPPSPARPPAGSTASTVLGDCIRKPPAVESAVFVPQNELRREPPLPAVAPRARDPSPPKTSSYKIVVKPSASPTSRRQ